MKFGKALSMVGLWVPVNGRPMGNNNKTFSGGTEGNGGWEVGIGKWGSPPEKVWWPPVLLIFYSFIMVKFYLIICYMSSQESMSSFSDSQSSTDYSQSLGSQDSYGSQSLETWDDCYESSFIDDISLSEDSWSSSQESE